MKNRTARLASCTGLVLTILFVTGTEVTAEPVVKVPATGTKLTWTCDNWPTNIIATYSHDGSGNLMIVQDYGDLAVKETYFGDLLLPHILKEHYNPKTKETTKIVYEEVHLNELRKLRQNGLAGSYKFDGKVNNFEFVTETKIEPDVEISSKFLNAGIKTLKIEESKINRRNGKTNSIAWYFFHGFPFPVSEGNVNVAGKTQHCDLVKIEIGGLNLTASLDSARRYSHAKTGADKMRQSLHIDDQTRHLNKIRKNHRDAVAVVVGNRSYNGHAPDVSFAYNDADAFKEYLLNWQGYREENIIDLRDASQAELMAVFGNQNSHEGKLFNYVRAGKSDVTVFYSGHGVPGQKDKRGYLLPVDADPNLIEINGYSIDVLFKNLALIPAKSMTVFLDACFSGDSPKGMIIRATSGLSVTPKMPSGAKGMVVITAAQGDQYASWDEEAKQGLFTKHLLAALKGEADKLKFGNDDGKISLAEVQRYLDDEMSYQARRRYGRKQTAYIRGNNSSLIAANWPRLPSLAP
jgi:hypothetical protein